MGSKRILVVDDELSIRRFCGWLLSRQGYEVLSAGGCEEARAQLGRLGSLDLMIVDLHLGDGDALDVVRAALDERPDLPVLLMTGGGEAYAGRLNGLGLTEEDVLMKPFLVETFEATIASRLV